MTAFGTIMLCITRCLSSECDEGGWAGIAVSNAQSEVVVSPSILGVD